MPTTILHLSDLHYGDDFIPWALKNRRGWKERPKDSTVNGLRDKLRETQPDYVVISGDFVNKASSASFTDAANFLRKLFLDAGVDLSKRVLVIPGNHDAPFWGRQPEARIRLKKYLKFADELFQDGSIVERQARFVMRDDAKQIIFLGLDTTLKTLRPRAEGEIGQGQLAWAEGELRRLREELRDEYDRFTKIAVMHHHLVPIPGGAAAGDRSMQLLDAEGIQTLLKANCFDLVLHGHRHIPHVSHIVRDDGAILAVVGAGTTLAPYPDQQGSYGNSFNLIELGDAPPETRVTRLNVTEGGGFSDQVGTKTFPRGRIPLKGYSVKRLRRIARIALNGDTAVMHEREGILVARNEKLRTLPLRVHCDTIGASIKDFHVARCDACTVHWNIQEPQMFEGRFVFNSDRTAADGPASIIYGYTIERGTSMKQSGSGNLPEFEEFSFTNSTDVGTMEMEFEFPKDYVVEVEVQFEKNGSILDKTVFAKQYSFKRDIAMNRWSFRMQSAKPDYSISFRWKLPK